jgi:hypothetical protein
LAAQGVTPGSPMGKDRESGPTSRRRSAVRRRWSEGSQGSDEVANLTEVGAGRKSGSQARSDRNPETPQSRQRSAFGRRETGRASARGEGESPTSEPDCLGGGKGQESIGPPGRLTANGSGPDARSEQSSEVVETAREQRAPRGATAGRTGKALKAEILRADVARNKATRPGRDQTAERVRNPESGRCR